MNQRILIICIFLFISCLSQGQEIVQADTLQPSSVIFFDDNNPPRFPTKIKFLSGKIIDVRDVDPYKQLPFKVLRENSNGLERLYDIGKITDLEKENLLEGMRINEDTLCQKDYLRLSTKRPIYTSSPDKIFIAYHASFYCGDYEIIGTQGVVLVYNKFGELIDKIEDRQDGFYNILITSNGKYLIQKYGFDYGQCGDGQLYEGFRFYDTQSGNVVFEWELGKEHFAGYYNELWDTNFFHFSQSTGGKYHKYILDVDSKTVYYKSMGLKRFRTDLGYQKSLFPIFQISRESKDLLLDDFKLISR